MLSTYFKKEFAAAPFTDPSFDRHDLHKVVAKGDCQDGHGRHVQHWIKLADLTDKGNVLEVLVEKFIHLAREVGLFAMLGVA